MATPVSIVPNHRAERRIVKALGNLWVALMETTSNGRLRNRAWWEAHDLSRELERLERRLEVAA